MLISATERRRAYLYMHLSILLWGITGVLGRGIDLTEGVLVWYRMLITVGSLLIYVLVTGQSMKVSRKDAAMLIGVGTILMIHWLFFYGAIKYSNVSITLTMLSSQGLFTALLEPLLHRKKIRWDELFLGITAMCGIWLIFSTEASFSIGIILALLGAFVGAFFNILNKDLVSRHNSSVVSFYEIAAGLVVLTLLMPFYISYFHPHRLYPSSLDWVLLFILAVFCTHVTLMLSLSALRYLSAFTLNLSINLEPVYGILLAFFIYHENKQLHWGFFAGGAIIMLSVLMEAYFQSKKSTTDSVERVIGD
jgi:drug/metabolite transporter (DMT)-like permease